MVRRGFQKRGSGWQSNKGKDAQRVVSARTTVFKFEEQYTDPDGDED